MERLCITNTIFEHPEQYTWTHENGSRRRQIDYICIDQTRRGSVCGSQATADVGVGRDHQSVKMELLLKSAGSSKRKIRKPRRRWSPEDESIYAEALNVNIVLLKAEDIWRDVALKEKCVALEKVLLETEERCRELKYKATCETQDHFAYVETLMDKRRLARERRD